MDKINLEKIVSYLPTSLARLVINCKAWFIYYFLIDVYVFSYPRSGITWTKFFLMHYQALVYDIAPTLNFGDTFKKAARKAPRVSISCTGPVQYQETHMSRLKAIKGGEMEAFMAGVLKKHKGKDVVVFARDPRDVVVSFFTHLGMHEKGMTISEFIRDDTYGIGPLITYYNSFILAKKGFGSFYISRYEDKKSDPHRYFSILVKELKYPVDEGMVQKAVASSSFERMQKIQEGDSGIEAEQFISHANRKNNGPRVRKGKAGGYKDVLSDRDLEFVSEQMEALSREYGYSTV